MAVGRRRARRPRQTQGLARLTKSDRPPTDYPVGRICPTCAKLGRTTLLNRYNRGPNCLTHQRQHLTKDGRCLAGA